MTYAVWKTRLNKIKTHLSNADLNALTDETKQYLYWKGIMTVPPTVNKLASEPASSLTYSKREVWDDADNEPTSNSESSFTIGEDEFWDDADIDLTRDVSWLAAYDGLLGQWAQEEMLNGKHISHVLPELLSTTNDQLPRTVLILGCGDMRAEHSTLLHPDIKFGQVDAYDISTHSIQKAKEFTDTLGLEVNYHVADVNQLQLPPNKYDLVICCFAYHHFREVEHVAIQIGQTLTENGIFLTIDYVGPPRLQYTSEQIHWANHLLSNIEDKYRQEISGKIRTEVSSIPIEHISPDEAPCSDQILDAMNRHLNVIYQYNWAGLLYPLLEGLGQNFPNRSDNQEQARFFFDLDRLLVSAEIIPPNYTITLAKKC